MMQGAEVVAAAGQLLLDHFGLVLQPDELGRALARARQALGDEVAWDDDPAALQVLCNSVTVTESHFFRDAGQFGALEQHILPELIERRRNTRALRIWSAGCASGEEPYSIAILLRELLPDVDRWTIQLVGTDINTDALERARQGVYTAWSFREERARLVLQQGRYFRHVGERYALLPEVQRMVRFDTHNLADPFYPASLLWQDLILCRNVGIYLADTQALARRLTETLVVGGWLVVGSAEHADDAGLARHVFPGALVYQRPFFATTTAPPPRPLPPPQPELPALDRLLEKCRTFADQGELDLAERLCQQALAVDPSQCEALQTLALVQRERGSSVAAIGTLRRLLTAEPTHVWGCFTLAQLLREVGQTDRARALLERAAEGLSGLADGDPVPASAGTTCAWLRDALVREFELLKEAEL